MKPKNEGGNEKGFVLILALVTMIAMTVIGLSAVMNMTTDLQLARNERESKLAFQLADAGINEAMARLKLTLTPSPPYVGEPNPPAGTSNVRTTGFRGSAPRPSIASNSCDIVIVAYPAHCR